MSRHSKEVSEKSIFNADTRRLHADIRRFYRRDNLRPSALDLRKSAFRRLFQRSPKTKGINRIIDANINRAKEGLRVCEEITRFILNSPKLTSRFKKIRHRIGSLVKQLYVGDLLRERQSLKDVGRDIYIKELERKNFQDIFFANIQRVKESIRVLEEFTKLIDKNFAIQFKKVRYSIYEIEKDTAKRISALSNY